MLRHVPSLYVQLGTAKMSATWKILSSLGSGEFALFSSDSWGFHGVSAPAPFIRVQEKSGPATVYKLAHTRLSERQSFFEAFK